MCTILLLGSTHASLVMLWYVRGNSNWFVLWKDPETPVISTKELTIPIISHRFLCVSFALSTFRMSGKNGVNSL